MGFQLVCLINYKPYYENGFVSGEKQSKNVGIHNTLRENDRKVICTHCDVVVVTLKE